MNDQTHRAEQLNILALETFNKARAYAYWSLVGLVIPIVGIILGLMSKSILKTLTAANENENEEMNRIWSLASWGVGLSIAGIVVWIITVIVSVALGVQEANSLQTVRYNY
jgi:hypothetical protein